MSPARPAAVPRKTPRDRRSRWSRGEPRLKVRLAQRRKLGVKEADYSAFQRFQKCSAVDAVRLYRMRSLPQKNGAPYQADVLLNRTRLGHLVLPLTSFKSCGIHVHRDDRA